MLVILNIYLIPQAIDLQHSKLRYLLLKLEPQVNTPDNKHCVLNRWFVNVSSLPLRNRSDLQVEHEIARPTRPTEFGSKIVIKLYLLFL